MVRMELPQDEAGENRKKKLKIFFVSFSNQDHRDHQDHPTFSLDSPNRLPQLDQ